MKKAVCLMSGGIDSTTSAYIAKAEGYEVYGLAFDYGQRHRKEIEAVKSIAKRLGIKELKTIKINLHEIGGSALTVDIAVPERRSADGILQSEEVPITYVPARNTIFLSFALAYAEVVNADAIFIGANVLDYSGYPDCRPEYLEAFQRMANLATKRAIEGERVEVKAPLLRFSKAEIIKKGAKLGVPFELTWSCYKGGKKACGKCDSCLLRLKGFAEAGLEDPIEYGE
jgi:7-cyano-7-deazaguanine synthase